MTGEAAELLLREYEEQILDRHHLTFKSFWAIPDEHRAYALLAAFDSLVLSHLRAYASGVLDDAARGMKYVEEGLGQALRWCLEDHATQQIASTSSADTIEAGGRFLLYASEYAQLADFHKAYGRGLVTVSVDREAKRVRFDYRSREEQIQVHVGFDESIRLTGAGVRAGERMARLVMAIPDLGRHLRQIECRCLDGRISISNVARLCDEGVVRLVDELMKPESVRFPPDTDLGGFRFGEFVSFWSAMLRWTIAAEVLFFQKVATGTPAHECAPTQIVDRRAFCSSIQQLSGLGSRQVEAILARLLFAGRSSNADVFLRPIVGVGDDVSWSASVILNSRFVRNMLKSMARTPPLKPTADLLIGIGATQLCRQIGKALASHGYQFSLNRMVSSGNEDGEIDLLAWHNRSRKEVLLIEAKACLEPDEVNEVDAFTEELIKGQRQLSRVSRILKRMDSHNKKEKFPFVPWDECPDLFGVVVSRIGLPNNRYIHETYPASALGTMRRFLRPRDWKRPSRMRDALAEQPWLDGLRAAACTASYNEIRIGGITYELPSTDLARGPMVG